MRLIYDHQIFTAQKFGGITRYFNELCKLNDNGVKVAIRNKSFSIEPILLPKKKLNIISKGACLLKKKIGMNEAPILDSTLDRSNTDILESDDYDLFHPTYYDPYFLSLIKKPFVVTVHDMIHEIYKEFFPLSDPTSQDKRLLCQAANKILAVSENTKKDLIELFGISPNKIHVTHLASDFGLVEPTAPLNLGEVKRYILYVGTRYHYKNFYFSILSLVDLLRSDGDLQILCTGSNFTNEEVSLFKNLQINNQVKHYFPNNDEELSWLYRNAALLIFPSLYEGFGLPVLEAFATECPVAASNSGSIPEVGGDAALYFNPKSKTEIVDCVSSILYNQKQRNLLVDKGKAQIKNYSWDKCRSETLKVYESIIDC